MRPPGMSNETSSTATVGPNVFRGPRAEMRAARTASGFHPDAGEAGRTGDGPHGDDEGDDPGGVGERQREDEGHDGDDGDEQCSEEEAQVVHDCPFRAEASTKAGAGCLTPPRGVQVAAIAEIAV